MKSSDKSKARELLRQQTHVALASQSRRHPGFPYLSWVPFVAHGEGRLLTLVADIAEHTLNLLTNERVALMLVDDLEHHVAGEGEPLSVARLSLFAQARRLPLEELESVAASFYERHPAMQDYHLRLNFVFFELAVIEARFIGGFARAGWLQAADLRLD